MVTSLQCSHQQWSSRFAAYARQRRCGQQGVGGTRAHRDRSAMLLADKLDLQNKLKVNILQVRAAAPARRCRAHATARRWLTRPAALAGLLPSPTD